MTKNSVAGCCSGDGLIAEWPATTYSLLSSPVFGPHGEVFALATDGTVLRLHITLPGA